MKLEVRKTRAAAVATHLIACRAAQEACDRTDKPLSTAEGQNHEIRR